MCQKAGYDYFTHGIGHGIGLDIHEIPLTLVTLTDYRSFSMVLTDEPGVYLADKYGVRIEDSIVSQKMVVVVPCAWN